MVSHVVGLENSKTYASYDKRARAPSKLREHISLESMLDELYRVTV